MVILTKINRFLRAYCMQSLTVIPPKCMHWIFTMKVSSCSVHTFLYVAVDGKSYSCDSQDFGI